MKALDIATILIIVIASLLMWATDNMKTEGFYKIVLLAMILRAIIGV